MLKYDNNTVGKVNEGATPILKAYKGGVMCFNNGLEGGTYTPSQVPCFWVTSDITHYEGNFEDVYDQTTEKWYKLNNLGEYEEYGIYGDTRNTTTYIGKLVIENGYEYEWDGTQWDNLGTGSSITIKSPEYLERSANATGYVALGEYFQENTTIDIDFQMTRVDGFAVLGDYFSNDNDDWRFFIGAHNTSQKVIMYDFDTTRVQTTPSSNFDRFHWEVGNYYIKNLDSGTNVLTGTPHTNFTRPNQMFLFHLEGSASGQQNVDYGHIYTIDIKQNGTLAKQFIPWTDMNGNYGLYDKVANEIHYSVGQMTGSSVVNDVTIEGSLPKHYEEKEAPEDNVSFSSFTEARSYECPWVLQKATIKKPTNQYYFDYNYEWVKGTEPTEPLTKWVETGDEICYEGYFYDDSEEKYESYDNATWYPTGKLRPIGEAGEECGLPDVPFILNYNAKEYDASTHTIPKTQGQLQNVDAVVDFGASNVIDHSVDGYISSTGTSRNGGCRFSISGNNGTYLNRNNTSTGCTLTIVSKAKNNGGSSSHTIMANRAGAGTSTMNWMWRYESTRLYFSPNNAQGTDVLACDTSETPIIASVNVYYDGDIKKQYKDWTNNTQSSVFSHSYLNAQPTNGGSLLCDYSANNDEFFIGDFYWVYMTFENLTDEQIQQVIAYNEGL